MAAGWILGYYLVDRPFSVFPWGSVSMTLVGAGAGLYEILKILVSDQRGERDPHK
jgi:F0F1-type ATP synthase assembly protein I